MRIELAIQDARLAAWGPKMEPLQGKRKVGLFSERVIQKSGHSFAYRLRSTLAAALVKTELVILFPEKCLIWLWNKTTYSLYVKYRYYSAKNDTNLLIE